MPLAGKKMRIQFATAQAGPFTNNVAGIKNVRFRIAGNNQDVSEFGIEWIKRIQGLKDFTASMTGQHEPGDTNGQVAARTSLINDTQLWVRIQPDGGTTANAGILAPVKCSVFEVATEVAGVSGVTIELEGDGVAVAA
jgi:hypothetical protein